MQQWSACFSAAAPLRTSISDKITERNVSVCVLEDRGTVKKESDSRAANFPGRGKNGRSPFYTILPAELPKEQRPKPAPVHRSVPMIGFVLEHWFNLGTPESRAKKFNGIFKTSFMISPVHVVTDLQAIVDIQKDPEIFRSKGNFDVMEALFGSDVMTQIDGAHHASVRNTVAAAFAPALFPYFFDRILDRVHKTWRAVKRDVERKGRTKLDPIFRKHYLSIIVEMTTGIDMEPEIASFLQKRFFTLATAFFSPRFGPVWENGLKAQREIVAVLERVFKRNLSEKKDILEKLREYGENLAYQGTKDIRKGDVNVLLIAMANSDLKTGADEANDPDVVKKLMSLMLLLWFAGYATSAATSSCAAFEMGMDPNIWSTLEAEQNAIVAAAGSKDVTFEQVTSMMPLLDSFLTEMLRMHPAVIGVARVVAKDLNLLGHYVKAGDKVFLDFMAAMRDHRMYPDADKLIVDRFVRKPGKPSPPRVVSFGGPGSPHYCLGAALAKVLMKTTFAVLLREYHVEMDPKQSKKYGFIPDETPVSKVVVQKFEKRE